MFGRLQGSVVGWYTTVYIYIFGRSCPLTQFCPVQNSLYVQVLRSPILAALLQGTPAADVSQTLRRDTRNGITELSQMARPIFGRAAITLDIGPHSCPTSLPSPSVPTFTFCPPSSMPNFTPSVQRVAPAGRKPQNRPLSKLNTGGLRCAQCCR